MRKLLALLGVAVLALAAVVGARTFMAGSRQLAVAAVAPVTVDASAAAARLARAVRFKTVASATDPSANAAEFAGLQAHLERSFPKAHAVLRRERVGQALLYTWPGSDPKAPPIALMAHQDVVPVAAGSQPDWQAAPFGGEISDGFIWGRGAWDDKGNLMAIMEAVELRAAAGFQPRQTVYLVFGADEEVGGARGAQQVARLLKERGVRLQFVLDEGLLITEGALQGLSAPAALVGVAEKGYLTVQLTASAAAGHSSMPPAQPGLSAIGMLGAALTRLDERQLPLAIRGLVQEMFETLGPEMGGLNRVLFANLWLFKPLVEMQLQKSASANATLRTTTALTGIRSGDADNVLPRQAVATVNFRLVPGDSSDAVLEHVARTVANPAIAAHKVAGFSEPSRVAATAAPGFQLIARTLRQLHPDMVVAPGLMLGATDSRHFEGVADNIYKFSPVRARPLDLQRFHGSNERISIANYVELIQFYHQLIGNGSAAAALQDRSIP